MILTFDADGVIVECVDGIDNNPDARNNASYGSKAVAKNFDVKLFNQLILENTVYVVSARSFKNAAAGLRAWLYFNEIDVDRLQGVLCAEGMKNASDHKHEVVQWLGSDMHIEDHPNIVRKLGNKAILMPNPVYPDNTKAFYTLDNTEYYRAHDLREVAHIIERTKQTCHSL